MRDVQYGSIRIVILCLLWYITSAGNGVIGKLLLQAFPFPLTVTMVQLLSITIYSTPTLKYISGPRRSPSVSWNYYFKLIIPLAFGKFFASVSGHISLWAVPVSYAATVKATMPLFVVVLSRIILGEKQTTKVYLSLFPIILGVIIATVTELEFNMIGLVSALLATLAFSLQNIFSKKVLKESSIHHLRLLHLLARIALIMFIPIWLWHDLHDIIRQDRVTTVDSWVICTLLFLDGLANFLQNVIAFTVLSLVTPLTYSVCNASKRIAVITFSILMLKNPVTYLNIVGMSMAIFGVFYYNKAKHDSQKETDMKPILPVTKTDTNLLLKNAQIHNHQFNHFYLNKNHKEDGVLKNGFVSHQFHYQNI